MSNVGKLRVKPLAELRDTETTINTQVHNDEIVTPQVNKTKRSTRKAVTTLRKSKSVTSKEATPSEFAPTTSGKKWARTTKKEISVVTGQSRIDTYFKSTSKTYTVNVTLETVKSSGKENNTKKGKMALKSKRKTGRKRLFDDSPSETESEFTDISPPSRRKTIRKRKSPRISVHKSKRTTPKDSIVTDIVDLCSDTDDNEAANAMPVASLEKQCDDVETADSMTEDLPRSFPKLASTEMNLKSPNRQCSNKLINGSVEVEVELPCDVVINPPLISADGSNGSSRTSSITNEIETSTRGRQRKPRPLPPYKVVASTSFAVDAFQFGYIEGVSHYFLSHFHADHYIGLNRSFAMPLYVSSTTALLVRSFIPIQEEFLNILELNSPQIIEDIEVTAIDANHCPGAVMFIFKLPTGECILHTGDFRANSEMESEPIFWNNNIDTIYLDTTYISRKYAFCTQQESIDNAKNLIHEFQEKHKGKRILYVCGSYLIGKEKFWSALAEEFSFKVWAEGNRKKSLEAMQNANYLKFLRDYPWEADMHIIPLGKISYLALVEYFEQHSKHFDILLALRPSGWEKNKRPQYRGQINIIGIEYSEHSSYTEMQRFVSYLKPREVISTVPAKHDLMQTSCVPLKWYKYDKLSANHGNFQPSITSYLKLETPQVTPGTSNGGKTASNTPLSSRHDSNFNVSSAGAGDMSSTSTSINSNILPTTPDTPNDVQELHDCAISVKIDADADADDDWIS